MKKSTDARSARWETFDFNRNNREGSKLVQSMERRQIGQRERLARRDKCGRNARAL